MDSGNCGGGIGFCQFQWFTDIGIRWHRTMQRRRKSVNPNSAKWLNVQQPEATSQNEGISIDPVPAIVPSSQRPTVTFAEEGTPTAAVVPVEMESANPLLMPSSSAGETPGCQTSRTLPERRAPSERVRRKPGGLKDYVES